MSEQSVSFKKSTYTQERSSPIGRSAERIVFIPRAHIAFYASASPYVYRVISLT